MEEGKEGAGRQAIPVRELLGIHDEKKNQVARLDLRVLPAEMNGFSCSKGYQ